MKKILSIVLAAIMVMALGVTAFAAETVVPTSGSVRIYKDGTFGTDEQAFSMADDALVDKTWTATVDGSNVVITMDVIEIEKMGMYGYILSDSVLTVNGSEIDFDITAAPYYEEGVLTLYIPVAVFESANDTVIVEADFSIGLFANNIFTGVHTSVTSMDSVADIYLTY